MIEVFVEFETLLKKRFSSEVITTEDSVRYTFFAALMKLGISPEQVVLEYPHPAIERAKIDTWLPVYKEGSIAVEFKYDRDPPGGNNQPRTQKAGAIFKDLRRQALVALAIGVRSYFVYVTSEEMANYFRNPINGHSGLWDLESNDFVEIKHQYFLNKPRTFMNTLGSSFEAKVIGVFHSNLPGGNYIRAYEVVPLNN